MTWAIAEKGCSQRRACGLVGIAPKTDRYASIRPNDDGLRKKLRKLAHERRRFGYRRLHIPLRRAGVAINHKRLFRLYREERLTVRRRAGRKRDPHPGAHGDPARHEPTVLGRRRTGCLGRRPALRSPLCSNQRRTRLVFAVVDDFSRGCLALVVDRSISGKWVKRELAKIAELRGKPCMIVSGRHPGATGSSPMATERS